MIYFLSDTHIGTQATIDEHAHQQRVVAFLDSIKTDATAVYLLGDIFDFWFEYRYTIPKGYDRILGKLAEMTDSGIEVHFFVGNHDMWTFGYLEKEIGLIVHYKEEILDLNGKRCLLAHGHTLYTHDRRFMMLQRAFKSPLNQWLFRNILPASLGLKWGNAWSRSSRQKEMNDPYPYQGEQNECLVAWAKEHEKVEHLNYYIFGHRHIELDLLLATDARVVILGDGFRQYTYGKMDDNGQLTLENY